MNKTVNAICCF